MADGEEDIDRFLYGEEGFVYLKSQLLILLADAVKQVPKPIPTPTTPTTKIKEEEEEGAVVQEDEEDEDEEIEIVLGEGDKKVTTAARPTIDLNAVGQLNGTSILETDLESFEDRPWRKPGADMTDYFNYGFNEVTWRAYCSKQRTIREDPTFREISTATTTSSFPPMPMMPPGMPPLPGRPPMMPFPMPPFMFRPPPPNREKSRSPSRERRRTRRRSRTPSPADRDTKRRRD